MKILQLNNYHYIRGGAERYYFELSDLLKKKGHDIIYFSVEDEKNLKCPFSMYFGKKMSFDQSQGILKKLETSLRMLYSFENNRKISALIEKYPVDIAHAHNIYHRVCPSVFNVLKKKHIPIVMTLHDYKIGCPIYTFYRNNSICTECIDIGKYRVVKNRCTKGSFLLSMFHFIEAKIHEIMKIYIKNVDIFICPSYFLLKKHLEAGIPEYKLINIPNFINVSFFTPKFNVGDYILYVGRLSNEKGILTAIKAVQHLDVQLKIVGDGPMRNVCEGFVKENSLKNVKFEGYKTGDELKELFRNAAFVVFPSEWYENAPMVVLESFAYGKPVIGSNLGGVPEMIIDEKTGLLFQPGDYQELREKIKYLLANPSLIEKMGRNARQRVEEEYNEELHYKRIMEIYTKLV